MQVAVSRCVGEFDLASAAQLLQAMAQLRVQPDSRLMLDLLDHCAALAGAAVGAREEELEQEAEAAPEEPSSSSKAETSAAVANLITATFELGYTPREPWLNSMMQLLGPDVKGLGPGTQQRIGSMRSKQEQAGGGAY